MTPPDPNTQLAETRAFTAELERVLATMPSVHTVPPQQTRRARREGTGIFPAPVFLPQARTEVIDGPGGPLPLRIIVPERESTGAFLHIHGGGWTLGENDMQDPRLERLARDTGLTVVSVGYRLAPENPYPAGPDDCEAAALWLLSHARETVMIARPRVHDDLNGADALKLIGRPRMHAGGQSLGVAGSVLTRLPRLAGPAHQRSAATHPWRRVFGAPSVASPPVLE